MKVWHSDKLTSGFGSGTMNFPQEYTLVAEVDTDSAEEAFRLTNAIDQPWHLNEGVRLIDPGPHRSTSIGDVIVTDDDKTLFLVMPVGMKQKPFKGVPQKFLANLFSGEVS